MVPDPEDWEVFCTFPSWDVIVAEFLMLMYNLENWNVVVLFTFCFWISIANVYLVGLTSRWISRHPLAYLHNCNTISLLSTLSSYFSYYEYNLEPKNVRHKIVLVLGLCPLKFYLAKLHLWNIIYMCNIPFYSHCTYMTLWNEKFSHDVCWVFPVSALHRDGTNPYQSII